MGRVSFTASECKAASHLLIMPFNPVNWVSGKQQQWAWEIKQHLYSSPLLHTVEKREGSCPKYTSAGPDTEVSNYCHQDGSQHSHSDDKDAIFASPKLSPQGRALSGNCGVLCVCAQLRMSSCCCGDAGALTPTAE